MPKIPINAVFLLLIGATDDHLARSHSLSALNQCRLGISFSGTILRQRPQIYSWGALCDSLISAIR